MDGNLEKDEPLYKLHPDSDFELLLFARTQIKELQEVIRMQQVEIGKRDSEILELRHFIKKNKECRNGERAQIAENKLGEFKKLYEKIKRERDNLFHEVTLYKAGKK